MESETKSPFLTTPEAAGYLRLSPATLESWRCRGDGPPFRKLGRLVVYARQDLESFAQHQMRVSTSDPGTSNG